jgi:alpha/beta superfamily hydrolase
MNSFTQKFELAGPAGRLQCQRDTPDGASRGTAVIAHPHPLFGGTMDNKVVQTIARAFVQSGWTAVRFNFRGVGSSEGSHDEGRGEVDDMLAAVTGAAADGPLALAGFSFGAFVAARALESLWSRRAVERLVLVGTAASRFAVPVLPAEAHERTLVVHGEQDDTVPLASVMDWARPQALPVTVVPGGEHFFHGQLPLLKGLVLRHLR